MRLDARMACLFTPQLHRTLARDNKLQNLLITRTITCEGIISQRPQADGKLFRTCSITLVCPGKESHAWSASPSHCKTTRGHKLQITEFIERFFLQSRNWLLIL